MEDVSPAAGRRGAAMLGNCNNADILAIVTRFVQVLSCPERKKGTAGRARAHRNGWPVSSQRVNKWLSTLRTGSDRVA